jgi:hypothetical protein
MDRMKTHLKVNKELVIIETKSDAENNDSNSRYLFFNFKSLIRNSPKPLVSIIPINCWEINEYSVNLELSLT